MSRSEENLAIFGGTPTRAQDWPAWPKSDDATAAALQDVLLSGRWAISGAYRDRPSQDRRFAAAFAAYNGAAHCVPVSSGTASLTAALQALDIGPGDEVLVPGLTWVACASSTFSVGATPVLVDIDSSNLAMSPIHARAAITRNTKAIMLVHPFCRIADLDAFCALSGETGIPLIEDCSQAHGATWRGRHVGTWGQIGCFSMQQSKVLTSGEGGAAITNDVRLFHRMEQARADGRIFSDAPLPGRLELLEVGEVLGQNHCLSEFQSAILCDRLKHLDGENRQRREFVAHLASELSADDPLRLLPEDERATSYTYYNLVLELDLPRFQGNAVDAIARALSMELNVQVSPVYRPLNAHPLYNPLNSPRAKSHPRREIFDPGQFHLPQAAAARERCITLPNWVLLGGASGANDVLRAVRKVLGQSLRLRDAPQEIGKEAF